MKKSTAKRLVMTAISLVIILSGCSESTGETYVDESAVREKYESIDENSVVDSMKTDDKSLVFLQGNFSSSADSFYICQYGDKIKVSLSSGEVVSMCDTTGCVHDENTSKDCLIYQSVNNIICTENGYYYTDYSQSGKLFFKSGDSSKEVFENTFFTDKEKEINPDHETDFSAFIHGNTMYIVGQVYMYTVDTETMKQSSEPAVISDSPIFNADTADGQFWITNENLELIRYDMNSGKTYKIDDTVWRVFCCGEKVYYVKAENDGNSIYVCNSDGSDCKRLIENVNLSFSVTEKSIYYSTDDGVYIFNLSDGTSEKIDLSLTYENGEDFSINATKNLYLINSGSSDYVYLLSYNQITGERCYNALFAITKDTTQYKAISLGIWAQEDEFSEGRVISY
jgi:hypothetical protein